VNTCDRRDLQQSQERDDGATHAQLLQSLDATSEALFQESSLSWMHKTSACALKLADDSTQLAKNKADAED
jgi:hypothetical protein